MRDLKQRALRSGFARLCGQATSFTLRIVSMVVMARLLDPKDYGLFAMVTAVTGFYVLFMNAGLSSATIQKATITDEQISTLFWINLLVGATLGLLCLATAPILVNFYHEPRLYWVTVVMAAAFLFGAAGVQHCALLERQLRYVVVTVIENLAQLVSMSVGIGMAIAGFGYWALVGASIVAPVIWTGCMWAITAWVPGMPRRKVAIKSMLRFGGTITLNRSIVYIAYNLEKVLLGRFWGADVLGIYGRAYQLINIPTENLNGAIGDVAFAALSRVQNDPVRLKSYFLKSYSLVNSLTIPITIFCAFFAEDIILVALGPKWHAVVPIFRLLSPTIFIFAAINPLGWLLMSIGLQERTLKIALVIAPLVISAYVIGLPYGPSGVAMGYSAAMTLWLIPHIVWCLHGTPISPWDLLRAISRPFLSAIAAAASTTLIESYWVHLQSALLRLVLESSVMFGLYLLMLLFVMGQKTFFLDLFRELRRPSSPAAEESIRTTYIDIDGESL
jgi:O-antigen/teichoic acid export membrane protein